jgi:predicted XRE-type DNA-binding protein
MQICMKIATEARENLAAKLKQSVEQQSVSFAEIARSTQIHPSQVSRICRGEFKTMSWNLVQICTFLGVEGFATSSPKRSEPARQRLERSVVALWDQTPADADRLIKLMRNLADIRGNGRGTPTD